MQVDEEHGGVRITTRPQAPPEYNPKEKTCLKCAHHEVCTVYRFAARFLGEEFPKDAQPFKPEEIAKICRLYNPLQRINGEGAPEL